LSHSQALSTPHAADAICKAMKVGITHWIEKDGMYLGYLNDYPDHWTQGESLTELRENLADLYGMFADKTIPGIRQVAELEVETA
jgi:predicted RNase H-like HicB family nuclease